jgi:hypothetical protein
VESWQVEGGTNLMKTLKTLNVGLSFLLELAMLAAFAYWGFQSETSVWLKWGLGILIPLAMAILWGFFFAPRAKQRLTILPGAVLSTGLFCLAAFALYQAHQPLLAFALALIAIFNRMLVFLWKQW